MPTVAQCKETFLSEIAPGNEGLFLKILTEADLRLLEVGRFQWCKTRVVLTPVDGFIVLPPIYASILGVQDQDGAPDIRAEEMEFTPYGFGEIAVGYGNVMLIDQGLNENDQRVYKVTGHLDDGETLKCLVHKAPAMLYDPELDDEGVPEEAVSTTVCPDLGALKLACFGIVFENAADLPNSRQYFATALKRLDDREKSRRGEARQTVNMRPLGPSIRPIRNFR